ncbi:uncharacterized protein LOC110225671 [Arabidopsis lyrata subsp. lyrata]|nr:uncharacterized protein LOC110225671 [Arabidopsis lyrata subsp. lyrata]|eukprot:XP_020871200.1 uncharacterized protein LOC110225671 [Arabidopsis lyrata subsp. lyrata]
MMDLLPIDLGMFGHGSADQLFCQADVDLVEHVWIGL